MKMETLLTEISNSFEKKKVEPVCAKSYARTKYTTVKQSRHSAQPQRAYGLSVSH